jgi:aspartyl-tRNA(Asn)/glutamyl-tRNA(Gln) amidotransferase subunit C
MAVDADTVRRVAHLARIAVADEEVEPMTSVTPMAMKTRKDEVTDGGIADAIMANAPAREDHFFLVPKVVE